MPGMQLTLKLKPVQRTPRPEPKRLLKLMEDCDRYVKYPDIKGLVKSSMNSIRESKIEDLSYRQKGAIKTLFHLRHDKFGYFEDTRWKPGDMLSKDRVLFIKYRSEFLDREQS